MTNQTNPLNPNLFPKISIITPSYNQGQFLEQTILSIINQKYPNLEYIIIDGGSTDNTLEIIKKYEEHITYWISEPDNGQTHAINKGLEKCTGTIFNWLNSDDWYLEETLMKVAKVFMENPNLQVLCGKEKYILNGQFVKEKTTFLEKTTEETIMKIQIAQPPTFFKLEALKSIGKLSEEMHYMFDAEMWIRFLLYHGITGVKQTPVFFNHFRLHEDSKTVQYTERFRKDMNTIFAVLKKLIDLPKNLDTNVLGREIDQKLVINIHNQWNLQRISINKKLLKKAFLKELFLIRFGQRRYNECRRILPFIFLFRINNFGFTLRKCLLIFPNFVLNRMKTIREIQQQDHA